jgi:hypothetical protein
MPPVIGNGRCSRSFSHRASSGPKGCEAGERRRRSVYACRERINRDLSSFSSWWSRCFGGFALWGLIGSSVNVWRWIINKESWGLLWRAIGLDGWFGGVCLLTQGVSTASVWRAKQHFFIKVGETVSYDPSRYRVWQPRLQPIYWFVYSFYFFRKINSITLRRSLTLSRVVWDYSSNSNQVW